MKKSYAHFLIIILCALSANAQEVFSKNDKYGIKDSIGKIIAKAKYDRIDNLTFGIAIMKYKNKYGIISAKGVEIAAPKYDEIKEINIFTNFLDVKLDNKWGVLDLEGKEVVVPKYYEPVEMSGNDYFVVSLLKSVVVSTGEKIKTYGVIDRSSKEIISPKYPFLEDKGFGYFKASMNEQNKKFGLLDENEKIVFEMKYDNIFAISKDIISIMKNKKWVLLNSKGYSISSVEYENIFRLFKNRAKVQRNGKFGYIDEKGKEVIPCKYDEAEVIFYEGKIKVKLNDLKFEIDSNGNEVTVSETIKPRNTLIFIDKEDEKDFNLIHFKEDVSSIENLKLVDNYLENRRNYDTVIMAIDNLMSEAANNKSAYREFTSYLYDKYAKSQYACFDAIPIHVAQNYICNADAPYGGGYWLKAENKKEICEYANKIKPTLCGEIISNVSLKLLPQTNSNYLKLNTVASKYTLLLFWKNECPYCEEQIKVLVSNYSDLQKLGLEIIGISLDEKAKDKCEQLIVANDMNWINTVDLNYSFSKKLNVNSLPFLYVLDKDKRILIKAISAEQVIKYLKR